MHTHTYILIFGNFSMYKYCVVPPIYLLFLQMSEMLAADGSVLIPSDLIQLSIPSMGTLSSMVVWYKGVNLGSLSSLEDIEGPCWLKNTQYNYSIFGSAKAFAQLHHNWVPFQPVWCLCSLMGFVADSILHWTSYKHILGSTP